MRIRMHGGYKPHELLDAFDAIVQSLVQNGIDEFRSINLYIDPYKASCRVHFDHQETGAPFRLLEFNGDFRKPFKMGSPRLLPMGEDGGASST